MIDIIRSKTFLLTLLLKVRIFLFGMQMKSDKDQNIVNHMLFVYFVTWLLFVFWLFFGKWQTCLSQYWFHASWNVHFATTRKQIHLFRVLQYFHIYSLVPSNTSMMYFQVQKTLNWSYHFTLSTPRIMIALIKLQ